MSFHLADLAIPPSIIASVAVASELVQAYTGWSLLISVVVAIVPGVIVGFYLGAFLSLGIAQFFSIPMRMTIDPNCSGEGVSQCVREGWVKFKKIKPIPVYTPGANRSGQSASQQRL